MVIQQEEDGNGRQGGVEMKKAEEEGREREIDARTVWWWAEAFNLANGD